jgi:hypothetical protein
MWETVAAAVLRTLVRNFANAVSDSRRLEAFSIGLSISIVLAFVTVLTKCSTKVPLNQKIKGYKDSQEIPFP